MKRLLGIVLLTLGLIASSSIFIHFSNCLTEPSSADKYNSYFRKWDRAIVDFCMRHKQKGPDYLNRCFEMFDETKPADPDHASKCSDTCPLPRARTERFVKTTAGMDKGMSMEKFNEASNLVRQSGVRD